MSRQQGWDDDRHYAMGLGCIGSLIVFVLKVWVASLLLVIPMGLLLEYGVPGGVVVLIPFLAVFLYDGHRKRHPKPYNPQRKQIGWVRIAGVLVLLWLLLQLL